MNKRGQPRRPRFNVRVSAEEIQRELDSLLPDDPMRELVGDGKGLDFRLPPPPWDESSIRQREMNLATLRVDPKATNQLAYMGNSLALVICRMHIDEETRKDYFTEDEGEVSTMFSYFYQLLADHPDLVKSHFDEIVRMLKELDQPPHRNFLAYKAYCDFLEEFGFDPTMPKLTNFIKTHPERYPVGIPKPAGNKEWWTLYFESGLVRLAE